MAKEGLHSYKVLLSVWWDRKSLLLFKHLNSNRTIQRTATGRSLSGWSQCLKKNYHICLQDEKCSAISIMLGNVHKKDIPKTEAILIENDAPHILFAGYCPILLSVILQSTISLGQKNNMNYVDIFRTAQDKYFSSWTNGFWKKGLAILLDKMRGLSEKKWRRWRSLKKSFLNLISKNKAYKSAGFMEYPNNCLYICCPIMATVCEPKLF